MHDGMVRVMKNIRHVLGLKKNLISISVLDSIGYKIVTEGGVMKVMKGTLIILQCDKIRSLYFLKGSTIKGGVIESLVGSSGFSDGVEVKSIDDKIVNLGSKGYSKVVSKEQCIGNKSVKQVEFVEKQPLMQQSLKGGRPIGIKSVRVCKSDVLPHAYTTVGRQNLCKWEDTRRKSHMRTISHEVGGKKTFESQQNIQLMECRVARKMKYEWKVKQIKNYFLMMMHLDGSLTCSLVWRVIHLKILKVWMKERRSSLSKAQV